MMRRKAFTLTEIIVGLLIMAIVSMVSVMSFGAARQTAKREAERLAAYIYRRMDQAVRMHKPFTLKIVLDQTTGITQVRINWKDDPPFEPSDGCRYSDNFPLGYVNYNASTQAFSQGGTITVKDAKEEKYYLIIEPPSRGGRIRLSDKKP